MSHGTRLFSYEDRDEIARLTATLDAAQREAASLRHAALLAAGIHGGPGAWRWRSDPQGTILDDAEAWERLLGEMRERTAPSPAERKPVAGWEVGHVPGYSARRAAPILRRGPICVRATEIGWEMIAESDEDNIESIQITSDSAASLEAAQLAAEDALRAIADRIYTALGPALTAAEIDASEKAEAEADMQASND